MLKFLITHYCSP